MVDRREFLKQLGVGTAAAIGALNWRAPAKPPEKLDGCEFRNDLVDTEWQILNDSIEFTQ